MDINVEFVWPRPATRNEIECVDSCLAFAPRRGARWVNYRPLEEETGLFLAFAFVDPEGGLLPFADRYGMLGGRLARPVLDKDFPKHLDAGRVEKVDDWFRAVTRMREAVTLWRAVQANDAAALAERIAWAADGRAVRYRPPKWAEESGPQEIASDLSNRELFAQVRPGDLAIPALFAVLQQIARHQHLNDVQTVAVWDGALRRPAVRLRPFGLLDALWLQFSLAVHGDKQYRQCLTCGRWFELDPKLNRADRKTCSTSCRVLAYRRRKEEAGRLHAKGRTPREIAAQLDSDPATVKRWLRDAATGTQPRRKEKAR